MKCITPNVTDALKNTNKTTVQLNFKMDNVIIDAGNIIVVSDPVFFPFTQQNRIFDLVTEELILKVSVLQFR